MNLVFFLEEPSAREMLRGLLPRMLPHSITIKYFVFEGKQNLERSIVKRLRGWRVPNSVFVVMRDQDSADCMAAKRALAERCRAAGTPEAVVRIVCRELESWYFGDLAAVESGLGLSNLVRHANKKKYRVPDEIRSPATELMKITSSAYQKLSGSRAIGPKLSPDSNKSHSFGVFVEGVRRAVGIDLPAAPPRRASPRVSP